MWVTFFSIVFPTILVVFALVSRSEGIAIVLVAKQYMLLSLSLNRPILDRMNYCPMNYLCGVKNRLGVCVANEKNLNEYLYGHPQPNSDRPVYGQMVFYSLMWKRRHPVRQPHV